MSTLSLRSQWCQLQPQWIPAGTVPCFVWSRRDQKSLCTQSVHLKMAVSWKSQDLGNLWFGRKMVELEIAGRVETIKIPGQTDQITLFQPIRELHPAINDHVFSDQPSRASTLSIQTVFLRPMRKSGCPASLPSYAFLSDLLLIP